ncbi:MAG TPA: aminotransferase class V-fold PLP-dependent enzyme [Chlamydiales bacterium]|jgi:cysteine desulfurase
MARKIALDAHETGRVAAPAVEAFTAGSDSWNRSALDELVGAGASDSFAFTHSGAEAIQQVHWTAFIERARKEGQCHFVTGPLEDAPTLQSLKRLEELGCFVKIAPVDALGRIDLSQLAELISPRTAMISLSVANALTGVVQPIEEIVQLARSKSVWLHLDASYALGKMESPFTHADYLTFAGNMIHSVPGSGGVFARKGLPLTPLILAPIEDAPSMSGLSAAARHASLSLDTMNLEVARLRDLFEEGLSALANPLFRDTVRLPNVSVLVFPHIHQEMLHHALKRKQLNASIGGNYAPLLHRQLIACGIDEITARCSLSFSLSRFNTEEEIVQAIEIVKTTAQNLAPLTQDLFA